MCLIVLALEQHREYPFIMIANRDEFYARPTAALQVWERQPGILAGRDLQHCGTWAGWENAGCFAALTNIRRPAAMTPGKRSRGELPLAFLREKCSPQEFAGQLAQGTDDYAPFNFLCGSPRHAYYFSSDALQPRRLASGIHGLSNASLDTPWPKLKHAKGKLAECLADKECLVLDDLYACVARSEPFPDDQLPRTGVPMAWERILSPPFIISEDYGTRSTLVVLVDRHGGLTMSERTFRAGLGPAVFHQRTYRRGADGAEIFAPCG